MSFEPFYIDYGSPRGMHAKIGGDPELVKEIENLGIGMDTSGDWAYGGPMVWRRPHGGRVLGWIRGVASSDLGRAGACRAWGVQAGPEDSIQYWPWYWELLQAEPALASLQELSAHLRVVPRGGPPSFPTELAGLLSECYRRRTRGEEERTFTIPLESKNELPALAWFWLLGPEDPERATLGPPRREPAAVSPPLTYAGRIVGARQQSCLVSPYVQTKIVQEVRQKKYQNALQAAQVLRELPRETLAATLDPGEPPVRKKTLFGFSKTSDSDREVRSTTEGPATPIPESGARFDFRDATPLDRIMIGLQIITILLGVAFYLDFRSRHRPADGSGLQGSGTAAATLTDTSTAATTVSTTAGGEIPTDSGPMTAAEFRDTVFLALRNRQGVTYGGKMATLNAPTTRSTAIDPTQLRTAALQLYFLRQSCSAVGSTIDGQVGPGFYAALRCLGQKNDPLDVLVDDQKLVDWLQANQ